MISRQRVIYSDNGVLTDQSKAASNMFSAPITTALVTAEDYIYVGSDLPFNHRYFQVSTANTNSSVMSVDIWDGNDWTAAVDVIDYTSVGGKTLATKGIISWSLDRTGFFGAEEDTADIPALSTLKIFDMYWVRFKVSASLSATTAVDYIGFKFADDNDLGAYYPDLLHTSLLDAYETGKTTWETQHILAAEECINHLKSRKMIWSPNQILNWEQFRLAAVHKVAKNIYAAFGDAYNEQRSNAEKEFSKAMNLGITELDRNEDGRRDNNEKRQRVTNWNRS